jgi:hypothetical protein
MDCALNGGRTLILNANGHADHIRQHSDAVVKTSYISIRCQLEYASSEDDLWGRCCRPRGVYAATAAATHPSIWWLQFQPTGRSVLQVR